MIVRDIKFKEDGISIFENEINRNDDYNPKGLDNLYSQEEKHFWFIARKEFILKSIEKIIPKNEKIIEIGAGTGNVSRFLQKNGYKDISIGEMHLSGLKYARTYGIEKCYQFDLLDTPFEEEFDAVCMFDVLEHIENDDKALINTNKTLIKEGKIVLTVPSHMWLWNRDDAIAGHKIRYTKKQLVEKLEQNGFKVLSARYFFASIVPLLFLRKMLNGDNGSKVRANEHDKDISMNPIISNILLFISRIENKINRFIPNLFGGSLLIVGEKVDTLQ